MAVNLVRIVDNEAIHAITRATAVKSLSNNSFPRSAQAGAAKGQAGAGRHLKPAGSRNKFAFDPKRSTFILKAVLPAPYDFGFLSQTIAPEGDALDVLLLMNEPAYPGVCVRGRRSSFAEASQDRK